jgi:GDP/UDP-N,N'-diacetylbacillosamine 2-epimerase (hydrolysing)
MKRQICVVTGSRAEFGLLKWVMHEIQESQELELQVIATGMHLSPEYGLTSKDIEQSGFFIDYKVDMLLGATTVTAVTKSVGLGVIGFADAYSNIKPDLIVVLGDRFELISAVTAALIACIPVAHLHGGEVTEGAYDDAIRHSITKMSHLHFVATDEYARRVIQLGEDPDRVFLVGGLGVDSIKRTKLLSLADLEMSLDFKFGKKNLLVTFHPVTLDGGSSSIQMNMLLEALLELEDTHLIFTLPNADTGSQELSKLVKNFVTHRPNSCVFSSLGQQRFLSCMQYVDAVVGNSSSGIVEAPSMGIGTINIGDRQRGRLYAESVIHCAPTYEGINSALQKLYDPSFKKLIQSSINPYGNGGASKRIVEIIERQPLDCLIKKCFYDLSLKAM